ncbi:DUF922 domain-containing protein [Maribacter algicola]|uniref:DUF922 domain-containing protein n=1 Tax=Maribacter algicola TaxID=2498892 RepID=UPI001FB3DE19|nr:DUF922 domain-containing protein [Maribacter algicola]
MWRYILVLKILFTFYSSFIWAQEEILWSPHGKLEWRDFQGDVPPGSKAAATTASGISYSFSTFFENGEMKVNYKVESFFYPTKSWFRPKICNDVTLLHEQLHFDISEVFARKMDSEMSETKFTKNIKQEVRLLYKRILTELDAFQRRYDLETDFSRNIEKQKLWQKQISSMLKENENF